MPGNAKTNDFMLGMATVMLGPQADLYKFQPSTHSIGMVKNFSLTAEPSYTELTQGVQNTIVDSVMTSNPVRASMEVYEYTRKNLIYALGLSGADTATAFTAASTLASQVVGGPSVTTIDVATGDGSSFAAEDMITIEGDTDDFVQVRKVASVAGDTLTLAQVIDTGMTFPAGSAVKKVGSIALGSKTNQPYYASLIVGNLSNGTTVAIQLAKLRIMKGFNLSFSSENYGNMPMEFSLYDLTDSDTFFADFGSTPGRILRA